MSETYPHLQLRPVGTSERRKRPAGFGYQKAERDHEYFYKATARKLRSLKEEHKKTKAIYSRYLNPNLIFKVTLTNSRWKCALGARPDTMKLRYRMERITISRNGPQKWSVPYGWRQAVQRRNNTGIMAVDVSDMGACAERRHVRIPVEGACVSRGRAGYAGQTPGSAHPSTWRISSG